MAVNLSALRTGRCFTPQKPQGLMRPEFFLKNEILVPRMIMLYETWQEFIDDTQHDMTS
jgi:hypothetical protein